jgi:hypothetical protein
MLSKLKSNRGYIFTLEALLVAMLFISAFYLTYMMYSNNYLTSLEEKRNIEGFQRANLKTDVMFKKAELPGEGYYKEFLEEVCKRYWGTDKMVGTLNPYENVSSIGGFVANKTIGNLNTAFPNATSLFIKSRNLLVAVSTYKANNVLKFNETLTDNDVLYFKAENRDIKNIFLKPNTSTTVTLTINGVPLVINLSKRNNKISDIVENYSLMERNDVNEIKLLKTEPTASIQIKVIYGSNTKIYIAKLRPMNISAYTNYN